MGINSRRGTDGAASGLEAAERIRTAASETSECHSLRASIGGSKVLDDLNPVGRIGEQKIGLYAFQQPLSLDRIPTIPRQEPMASDLPSLPALNAPLLA